MSIFKKIGKVAVAIATAPVRAVAAVVLINKFRDK